LPDVEHLTEAKLMLITAKTRMDQGRKGFPRDVGEAGFNGL
jgi:hypothetical protein